MPNRVIREALLDSERYANAVPQARLLYHELLLLVDDFGLVPINPYFLRRRTTAAGGLTDDAIVVMLLNLTDQDLIRTYISAMGGTFAVLPRMRNTPRAQSPKWPTPPISLIADENDFNALRDFCTASAGKCLRVRPKPNTKPNTKPRKTMLADASDTAFDRFWQAYPETPNRGSKARARKHWKALKLDSIAEQVMASLAKWSSSERWQGDGGQYVKSPANWLAERLFEEPAPQLRSDRNTALDNAI